MLLALEYGKITAEPESDASLARSDQGWRGRAGNVLCDPDDFAATRDTFLATRDPRDPATLPTLGRTHHGPAQLWLC